MSKTSSTLSGAGIGAAAGTAVMPGIGTAIGAIGGGLLGFFGSGDGGGGPVPQYQADRKNYDYGGNMSATGQQRIDAYGAQGQNLRDQANDAQYGKIKDFNQQAYANNAAIQANYAASGQNINQARGQQEQALGRMQSGNDALAAYAQQGPGPSAAQAQLQAGANQSFAQQMAAARSGGGAGGSANALRGAAFQQAGIMGQENAQAAELRANENTAFHAQQLQALGAAQQGYGAEAGATQGLRSGDLSAGQLQAQTQLQSGQLQAGTALGTSGQNVTREGQQNQYSLGLGQMAGQQDQFAQNVYGQQLQANVADEARAQGGYDAATGLNTSQQNANTAGQYGMASAGLGAAAQMYSSDTRAKKDIAHAEGVSDALAALGGSARAQRDYETYQDQPDPTARLGVRSGSAGSPFANYDRERGAAVGRQFTSRDAAAAYGVPTARFADVSPANDVRSVPALAYNYRDPNAPGAAPGPQVGTSAQALEANPATAHLVRDTPNGKVVDGGRAGLLALPAIGEQQRQQDETNQRMSELEQQLAALGGKKARKPAGTYDQGALDDAYAREAAYR